MSAVGLDPDRVDASARRLIELTEELEVLIEAAIALAAAVGSPDLAINLGRQLLMVLNRIQEIAALLQAKADQMREAAGTGWPGALGADLGALVGKLFNDLGVLGGGLPAVCSDFDPPPDLDFDPGAGDYNVEDGGFLNHKKLDDLALREALYAAADAAELAGLPDAARHLRHYLNNTGDDLTVDPDVMMADVPGFDASVQKNLDAKIRAASEQAIKTGEPVPITDNWHGYYITKGESRNWFLAMGGVSHSVTGVAIPQPDGTVRVEYEVHVLDQYNWDEGKSTPIGPITVEDKQLAELHRAGVAKEYTMRGSTETKAATYDPTDGGTITLEGSCADVGAVDSPNPGGDRSGGADPRGGDPRGGDPRGGGDRTSGGDRPDGGRPGDERVPGGRGDQDDDRDSRERNDGRNPQPSDKGGSGSW